MAKSKLCEPALADLKRSGISAEDAAAAGMYSVDDASELGDGFKPEPALVLPYFDPRSPDGTGPLLNCKKKPFVRVRYLQQPQSKRGFFKTKHQRYAQAIGSGICAYFPQTDKFRWTEVLDDTDTPILITEGEKKALACCLQEVPAIGLGGVFNFMVGDELLPELDSVAWDGREVYICFDSDAATNPQIQAAEGRLATELSLKRSANVFLVRLPTLKGQDKTGLDDFLVAKGRDEFLTTCEKAQRLRRIDAAVLGLNHHVAWVEAEGAVYDMDRNEWVQKHHFTKGSRFSSLELIVPTLKGNSTKRVSVAEEWLIHPHAQRFDSVIFQPESEERVITAADGSRTLNLWQGYVAEEGDVAPFLELSEFLFSELPEDMRELPLNLMAYKAQNPGTKVPLAVVLIGEQGCGKSMWARIVREAFGKYGVAIPSKALLSEFNPWIEASLIGVIDEAQAMHLTKGADVLKGS